MAQAQDTKSIRVISYNAKLDGLDKGDCFKDISPYQYRNYRVLKVFNPDEFYLEYVPPSPTIPTFQKLQNFYNDDSRRYNYRIRTPFAHQGRIYVWYSSTEGTWNRVRLRDCGYPDQPTEAFSLDQDSIVNVEYKDLFEMNPDFYSWSPYAIRGFLPDIKPPGGAGEWPTETISALENICSPDKVFHGMVMDHCVIQAEPLDEGDSLKQPQLCLGLILIEKSPTVDKSVQSILLEQGLAQVEERVQPNNNNDLST